MILTDPIHFFKTSLRGFDKSLKYLPPLMIILVFLITFAINLDRCWSLLKVGFYVYNKKR